MQMKNKTMAIVITLILVTSMAISMSTLPPIKAEVINGINYDAPTAAAIHAGMNWPGLNANASTTRLTLWTRFHDQIPTHVYWMAAPNPVGVGQAFNVVMFNPQVPPNALLSNPVRYQMRLTVLKPDGTSETLPPAGTTSGNVGGGQGGAQNGVFVSDSTGSTYTAYTADQVGNYTLTVSFLQMTYLWNSTNGGVTNYDYYGTTWLASNFTSTISVQQDSVSLTLPLIQAMPTEYWARPIEGQNTNWYTVSSNWLSDSHDRDNGGMENRYQPDGTAPNSAHILWTRPTEDNGIVGGTNDGRTGTGNSFNAGSQYQPRNLNPIIMYGRLYYCPNVFYTGMGDFMDCVDLKTGQLIYEVNTTALVGTKFSLNAYTTSTNPSNSWFGYYYSQDDPNQHGIVNPGWLFTPNYGRSLQPERGIPQLTITSVPQVTTSVEIQGPAGENLRYILSNNSTNYYLAQWNSSKVIPASTDSATAPIPGNCPITPAASGTNTNWNGSMWVNSTVRASQGYASVSSPAFDWNISLPWYFSTSPQIRAAKLGDILFGSNGSWPSASGSPSYAYPDQVTIWAVSLNPNTLGQALYMKNLQVDDATDNTNYLFERASADAGVFVANEVPICKFHVYDMHTGTELFSTDAQANLNPYGYFTWPSQIAVTQTKLAYGMLYTGGYVGAVSAYNLTTGQLQWRNVYPSGGEKIQNFVQMLAMIADGKIYVGTHEHSADTPLYKGEQIHCLNATTGDTIWDMNAWGYPETFATADGVLVFWNNYDAQVYAVGKGPSAMTVSAPDTAAAFGAPVVIRGTVTDISAGTKQSQQAARFPNGVPAVSDASQQGWMDYVYMQKGKPSNTTGVPVALSVVDANGNFRGIGTATSDSSGMFSYTWTPDIQGSYTVIASFAGSESYWPSSAESSFAVSNPTPAASPYPVTTLPPTEMYFAASTIAVIIAIAIVGILVLRKRPQLK